jgi:hypothetical protein
MPRLEFQLEKFYRDASRGKWIGNKGESEKMPKSIQDFWVTFAQSLKTSSGSRDKLERFSKKIFILADEARVGFSA